MYQIDDFLQAGHLPPIVMLQDMANILVEQGKTACPAAWQQPMTAGVQTLRQQVSTQRLQAYIPKILQNAIFGLLLFAPVFPKKTRKRAGYYSLFSKTQTRKSSRPKPSILKYLGYSLVFLTVCVISIHCLAFYAMFAMISALTAATGMGVFLFLLIAVIDLGIKFFGLSMSPNFSQIGTLTPATQDLNGLKQALEGHPEVESRLREFITKAQFYLFLHIIDPVPLTVGILMLVLVATPFSSAIGITVLAATGTGVACYAATRGFFATRERARAATEHTVVGQVEASLSTGQGLIL